MTNESITYILGVLERSRGDDHIRARMAFIGLSEEMMDSQYGESGSTRRQILAACEKHVEVCDKAINEFKELVK